MSFPITTEDNVTRAIKALVDRWADIETERVLAWHIATVDESALPHLAATFGADGIRYVDGLPRTLLRDAVRLRRIRGTRGCLRRVLVAIGHATHTLVNETVLRRDGSIRYRGEPWRHGLDRHWAVGRLLVDVTGPLSAARARELRDAVAWAIPRHVVIVIIVREPGGNLTTYRDTGA